MSSTMYLLSIIVPVYNVEKYLRECLESVLLCKSPEYEVILINDGSTDGSGKICDEYCGEYDFISLVSQDNQGLSAARNSGISAAKGKYLLFLDSDDIIYDNSLEKIIGILKECDADLLFGRAYMFEDGSADFVLRQIDYDENTSLKPYQAFGRLDRVPEFWFAAWLVIIKRGFLIKNSLFFKVGIYHEDELWVPTVFVKADTAKFLNFGFYGYRINRPGSILATPNIKRSFDKLIIVDELDKVMAACDEERRYVLEKRQAYLILSIIWDLQSYREEHNNRYDALEQGLKERLGKLKYGKYKSVYFLCKLIGLKRASGLLKRRVHHK